MHEFGDPYIEWAEENSARESIDQDIAMDWKPVLFATFVRIRDPWGHLRDWNFNGFKTTLRKEMIESIIKDKGQFVAYNFYTNELRFESAPVNVPVYVNDELQTHKDWALNLWQASPEDNRLVLGLAYRGDVTHMCYELNSLDIEALIYKTAVDTWFFDAGKIYMRREDLKVAFKALGILSLH
jgi:hypothetical protein